MKITLKSLTDEAKKYSNPEKSIIILPGSPENNLQLYNAFIKEKIPFKIKHRDKQRENGEYIIDMNQIEIKKSNNYY